MKRKLIQGILIVCGILILLFIGYHVYLQYASELRLLFHPQVDQAALKKAVRSHGIETALLLGLLTAVMCAIPGLPTSVVGILVGISYGPVIGSIINVLGNSLGNITAIVLMKHIKFLDNSLFSNRWVKTISQMKYPKIGLLLGYTVPIIPTVLVNVTAYLLKIPLAQVFFLVLAGVLPCSVIYACGGAAIFHGSGKLIAILVVSILILVVIGLVINKKIPKHKTG